MEYEIDFLPVGEASKGGDAICFRFWSDSVPQFVGVIDGGTRSSGKALVEHVQKYYGTKRVDMVLATHPHTDHVSGLVDVLEGLDVQLLMMHLPWKHGENISHLFQDGRVTGKGINDRVQKALQQAHDLFKTAERLGVPVVEPYAGGWSPSPYIRFVGPTLEFYRNLLLEYTSTPAYSAVDSILEAMKSAGEKILSWVAEHWENESLIDPVEGTNAENNSSTITLLDFGDKRLLFTGDAGVPALEHACNNADQFGIPLQQFSFVQIPHHGSKRNVGPKILDRLLGPKGSQSEERYTAIVSVPVKGEPKHPSRKVTNAFRRRGAKVIATKGSSKYHYSSNAPAREGWTAVESLPFYEEVEDD